MPVVLSVEHTHHHGVGDDDARRVGTRREQAQRMTRLHHQCLVIGQFLQIFLYQTILQPVLRHLAGLAVCHQFVWIEGHLEVQVIVYHKLESLALDTVALVFVYGSGLDAPFGTETVGIDAAARLKFL